MTVQRSTTVVLLSLAALSLVVFSAGPARASLITGVTIHDVSSEFVYSVTDRGAVHIVDGSGLDVNGPGTHTVTPDGNMWCNNGVGQPWYPLPDDTDPYIVFDLGAQHALSSFRVWNYNEGTSIPVTYRGVKDVEILVSADDVTYNSMGIYTLVESPWTDTVDFSQTVPLIANDVRYVMFDILSNHDGAIYPTDGPGGSEGGHEGGIGYAMVGLSEIQFSVIPEPGTLALAACGLIALAVVARRRRHS